MSYSIPPECRTPVCFNCGCYQGPLGDWFASPNRPWQEGQTKDVQCPTCAKLAGETREKLFRHTIAHALGFVTRKGVMN